MLLETWPSRVGALLLYFTRVSYSGFERSRSVDQTESGRLRDTFIAYKSYIVHIYTFPVECKLPAECVSIG